MKKKLIFAILLGCISIAAITSDLYELAYPNSFPKPVYNFKRNPLSEAKIRLGQALFYDPILSKDSTISCASCHSPYNAFAHTDHDLSHGINDQVGTRNAPALFNLAWQSSFMWDGAINHLDVQSLAPISHPQEMGEDLKHVVEKLQRKKMYPKLFYQAFGERIITGEFVLKALSQFQLTLVSSNSKYDQVMEGKAEFSVQEAEGYALFQRSCNSCHVEPLFSNYGFANNGLPIDSTLDDFGKFGITQQDKDRLLFKIPSLRNLTYTYPYMHDGRFRKLKEVVNHYSHNIQPHSSLSQELTSFSPFSSKEQADLIAFLLTLNDQSFVFDPKNKYPKEILHPTAGY